MRAKILLIITFAILLALLSACGTVINIAIRAEIPEASITGTPQTTSTAIPSTVSAVTLVNLNVRSAPTTSVNNVIRVIPAGTTITPIGRNQAGTWLQLSDGWISNSPTLIRTTGNIFSLPSAGIDPTPTQERPKNRISYNINAEAIPNREYATQHFVEICPSTILVMNGLWYAVELYNLLHDICGTLVIHRGYSPLEGDEWFYRSAANFVEAWKREGHREIIRYSTNEPSFGGLRSLSEFVAADLELMRLAWENGFRVAMGNFSVGYYQPEQINSGGFDPYLRGLIQYNHFLAVHEYACCVLAFGVGQWSSGWLVDRTRVQPAAWPLAAALPDRLWDNQLPPYWYLLRSIWFLLRADYLGIERPQILVTEFGWDNLPDIKPQIEPLRSQFGLPQYFNDMRGVNTYPRLWAWYWPQWTFPQAACEQLKWADSVYPEEYLGFMLFTWNTNWLQTDFSGFANSEQYIFHDCLEDYSQN
jgi:hypothetical protein